MLQPLDDFLIDRCFQPLSHRVQRRVGWTCFRLAWFFLGMSIVGYLFDAYVDVRDGMEIGENIWTALGFRALLLPFLVLVLTVRLTMMDKHDAAGWTKRVGNSERLRGAFFRPLLVVLVGSTGIVGAFRVMFGDGDLIQLLLNHWGLAAWVVADYFAACTPLPPGWEKRTVPRGVFEAG